MWGFGTTLVVSGGTAQSVGFRGSKRFFFAEVNVPGYTGFIPGKAGRLPHPKA